MATYGGRGIPGGAGDAPANVVQCRAQHCRHRFSPACAAKLSAGCCTASTTRSVGACTGQVAQGTHSRRRFVTFCTLCLVIIPHSDSRCLPLGYLGFVIGQQSFSNWLNVYKPIRCVWHAADDHPQRSLCTHSSTYNRLQHHRGFKSTMVRAVAHTR